MSDPSPYVILDAAGWNVTKVDGDPTGGKMRYGKGDWELRVNWRPRHFFDGYLASRRRIGPATTVTLFGESVELWGYDRRDHTVLAPVQTETFLEVRGEGMECAAFVGLLGRLRRVHADEFDARLPADVVRPHQVAATVTRLLSGVETPDGFDGSTIELPPYQEPYHVAAYVTGSVGCAWIDHYAAARASGDSASQGRAVVAMRGSRRWPVLREVQDAGGWSEEFWCVADDMASGKPPDELHGRICQRISDGIDGASPRALLPAPDATRLPPPGGPVDRASAAPQGGTADESGMRLRKG
ncbi:MAG: hypothetical protein WB441_08465 [Nocardioidaceae bacterium]